jgi:hypothetical protein
MNKKVFATLTVMLIVASLLTITFTILPTFANNENECRVVEETGGYEEKCGDEEEGCNEVPGGCGEEEGHGEKENEGCFSDDDINDRCIDDEKNEDSCFASLGKVTGGGQIKLSCEGKGSFGFNVMSKEGYTSPKGELQYIDYITNMKIHCHDMTFLEVSSDKTWANFEGEYTIDGLEGFTYTVYVEDNGEPGKDDVFIITLNDGYSAGGTVLHGNIQIHTKS